MARQWSPQQLAKFQRTMKQKGKQPRWESSRTNALSVTLPEWTGFVLSAPDVRIVANAEIRLVILSPGRGKRAPQRFIVQLPSGTEISATRATAEKMRREAEGPGVRDSDVPPSS
jgi:hypothetical protein